MTVATVIVEFKNLNQVAIVVIVGLAKAVDR